MDFTAMNFQEYLDTVDPDCTGCGFCCIKTKCWVGQRVYPGTGVCQALEWDGERHVCALMQSPGALGEGYRKELHAGAGCCAGLNSWKREPLRNRIPQPKVPNPVPPVMQKFLAALGRQMVSGDVMYLTVCHFKTLLMDEGMTEEEAEDIGSRCLHYMKQNRSKFNEEFLG